MRDGEWGSVDTQRSFVAAGIRPPERGLRPAATKTRQQDSDMHATARSSRRVGVWLAATAVLAVVAMSIDALPYAPAQQPRAAAPAEKTVKFEFRDARWSDVLDWFSKETMLPFISTYKPTGSFNFIPPKLPNGQTREYTIPEVIDILNEALLLQKFVLIRREASFMIIPADERIDPAWLPRITVEDLPRRGKTEIVSVVKQLNNLNAFDWANEVRKMMGPFGEVTPL